MIAVPTTAVTPRVTDHVQHSLIALASVAVALLAMQVSAKDVYINEHLDVSSKLVIRSQAQKSAYGA